MATYEKLTPPSNGEAIRFENGLPVVPPTRLFPSSEAMAPG